MPPGYGFSEEEEDFVAAPRCDNYDNDRGSGAFPFDNVFHTAINEQAMNLYLSVYPHADTEEGVRCNSSSRSCGGLGSIIHISSALGNLLLCARSLSPRPETLFRIMLLNI